MYKEKSPVLGILGGLGPMATVYFYELLTAHTLVERDQDHIDIVISSRATTPDRSDFITGKSQDDPLAVMIPDAQRLEHFGAELIVLPCNTAHYFYDKLSEAVGVPIINIITETVAHIAAAGYRKAGILATRGTVGSHTYQRKCEEYGVGWMIPDECAQDRLTDIIFKEIKAGLPTDSEKFTALCGEMFDGGCDCVILGCTELSLLKKRLRLAKKYVDSTEVLAYRTIELCGRRPTGLDI